MNDTISLADWLDNQVGTGKAYATNVEIARAAGLSEKTIRRLRSGEEPGLATLKKLANGLGYPLDQLQRMAGILADDQEVQDDLTNYIASGLKRLPESDRKTIWVLVRRLLEEQEEENR